jgi:DNA-binding transcriptional regulator YiaG
MQPTSFRALRKSLGLTQAEAADLCGVGRTQVVAWEAGDPQPPLAAQLLLLACVCARPILNG